MNEQSTICAWEDLRTNDSRAVENLLREKFEQADAYRYNSASIRVRVVDSRFEGLNREPRFDLVEPILDTLDESIQLDLLNVLLLYPGEEKHSVEAMMGNAEFEHPTKSMP